MNTFELPPAITNLVKARNTLAAHYRNLLGDQNSNVELKFTLDGNLVGDLGEAIAAELFGIRLIETKSSEGIDGFAPDGKTTVQIKATGTGRGPAFRCTETRADHLLFFDLDFDRAAGTIVYNGPEKYVVELLPNVFEGQRAVTARQIRQVNQNVRASERLIKVDQK